MVSKYTKSGTFYVMSEFSSICHFALYKTQGTLCSESIKSNKIFPTLMPSSKNKTKFFKAI